MMPTLRQPLLETAPVSQRRAWAIAPCVCLLLAIASLVCLLVEKGRSLSSALALASSNGLGKLTVRVDGVDEQLTVVALSSTPSSIVSISGAALSLGHEPSATRGTRLWLAHDASLRPESYAQFALLGRTLSYRIDLSAVGCSCNTALYWVAMPGIGPDGTPERGAFGNYYCDSNRVGGVWCWELDTIEANMHAMQVAPHSCSAPAGEHIATCDRAGAAVNTRNVRPNGLCPSDECVIDSRRPFRHVQSFVADGAARRLVAIVNVLEQGGRTFAFNGTSDAAYLEAMSGPLDRGLVLTFQLWGGPWKLMSWLDEKTRCSGDCPVNARVVYSDISID